MIEERIKSDSLKSEFERFFGDIQVKQILSEDEFNDYFKDIFPDENNILNLIPRSDSFYAKAAVNSILFDRTKLLYKVIQFVSNKLYASKEKNLAKILEWVLKEVKDIRENTDKSSVQLQRVKNDVNHNSDMLNIFNFIEEYSNSQNIYKDSIASYSKKINQLNAQDSITQFNILKEINLVNDFNSITMPKAKLTTTSIYKVNTKHDSEFDEDLDLSNLSLSDDSFEKTFDSVYNVNNKIIPISEKVLNLIDTPEFNIFKLQKETKNPLHVVSDCLFLKQGCYSFFDYEKMDSLLIEIEKGYLNTNHYHNALHAADVTQTCFIYNKYAKIDQLLDLSSLDNFALLFSAIIHDYKHPGYNNMFMINTFDDLAIRYNDSSVLENYHVSEAFKLIRSCDKYNIFKSFSKEDLKAFRKRMVDMVIHTDMAFHGKLMSILKLKEEIKNKKEGLSEVKLFTLQQDYLNIILHAADISNASKPISIYVQWAERVINEFWNQGDVEKQKNLPISFLCDRKTVTIAKSQIGFIEGVVFPYFNSLNICFNNDLKFLLDNIEYNKTFYKKQKELDDMKKELE